MLLYCITIIYPASLIASKIIIIFKKSNVNSLEIYWLSLKTLTLWTGPNPFTFQVDLVLVTTAVSVSDWNKYAAVQESRGAEMLLLHFEYTLHFSDEKMMQSDSYSCWMKYCYSFLPLSDFVLSWSAALHLNYTQCRWSTAFSSWITLCPNLSKLLPHLRFTFSLSHVSFVLYLLAASEVPRTNKPWSFSLMGPSPSAVHHLVYLLHWFIALFTGQKPHSASE